MKNGPFIEHIVGIVGLSPVSVYDSVACWLNYINIKKAKINVGV